jgi:Kef-type K+ transport system membrane component KefB
MTPIQLAAVLGAVVLLASILSVELGITVALLELTLGVVVGNVFDLQSAEWLDFIAKFASIVLTFLVGMEVDPAYLRERARTPVTIGVTSFAGPFAIVALTVHFGLDWSWKAALIASTALATTSLAVVYAVLVQRGLIASEIGKLLMSATFATNICTATALTAIFIKPNAWFPVFLVVSIALIVVLPRIAAPFFRRYGGHIIEPEIKLVFLALFVLMVLADASNGHAVLPAFILGLVMGNHYREHRAEQQRLRVVAFAFLTPFFFVKSGMTVSLGAVASSVGLLGVLLALKLGPKIAFIYPLARRAVPRDAVFTTLMLSSGLTFGTIASLYGYNAHIIDEQQFSLLIAVVVITAIVPTAIAERWFLPEREDGEPGPRPVPAEEFV